LTTSAGYGLADSFLDLETARSYESRLHYPPETIDILAGLVGEPRAVLDLGCGTGFLARPLAPRVERIDAVDASAAMIDEAKRLPGGDEPRIRWIAAKAGEAPLDPPYGLVTAGQSLHLIDPNAVLPRLRGMRLAIVDVRPEPYPWTDELRAIIGHYSALKKWREREVVVEIEERGQYRREGYRQTTPVAFTQPIEDYLRAFHGMSSLSRVAIGAAADEFDREVRELVARHMSGPVVHLVVGHVTWGIVL
jgi:SAM-dependent methyltransferase